MKKFLFLLLFLSCKSIPIQEKEAAQIQKIETVKERVNSSNMSPRDKQETLDTLAAAQKMIREQGQTITECDVALDDSRPYFWYFWGLVSVLGLVLLVFAWRGLKSLFKPSV